MKRYYVSYTYIHADNGKQIFSSGKYTIANSTDIIEHMNTIADRNDNIMNFVILFIKEE